MRALLVVALAIAACARGAPATGTATGVTGAPRTPPAPARSATVQPRTEGEAWAGVRFDAGSPLVKRVIRGSPAERAGLRAGDVVMSLDGITATGASELVAYIRRQPPGAKLVFVVARAAEQLTLTVEVAVRPDIDTLVAAELADRAAPDFAAQLVRGPHSTRLADLRGQVVIVDFWATWCGPCAVTMPYLDKWQSMYGPKGLRIVGLSSESLADITAYLADHWLAYSIGLDANGDIASDYLVPGMPMLVVIDRRGIVRSVHVGADDIWTVESTIQKLL